MSHARPGYGSRPRGPRVWTRIPCRTLPRTPLVACFRRPGARRSRRRRAGRGSRCRSCDGPPRRRAVLAVGLTPAPRSGSSQEVADEVVDQVVTALGEDRLRVELHPAEVRPDEHVDVTGGRVGGDAHPVRQGDATRPADEGVVEADDLLTVTEVDPRLSPLEHDVLVAKGKPDPVAQHLVPEADCEERLLRGEQPVDGVAERGDLRLVAVTWVTWPGPDDHQVVTVEDSWCIVLVAYHAAAHAHHRQHVTQHV